MNDENDKITDWADAIAEFIHIYLNSTISVAIFTALIQCHLTFFEILLFGYLVTMFMYAMKWLTGVDKLV